MRGKTDVKRKEILDAASAVFRDRGYHGTSMDAISQKLGGSKATIYSYFKSKEELFSESIACNYQPISDRILAILDDIDGDIDDVLRSFGREFLKFSIMPEILVVYRTGMAGGAYQSLGPMLYEMGPKHFIGQIEAYIRRQVAKGRLTVEFPSIAAEQFFCLIECGVVQPLLFGNPPNMTLEVAIDAAVRTFLAAYGDHWRPTLPVRGKLAALPVDRELG